MIVYDKDRDTLEISRSLADPDRLKLTATQGSDAAILIFNGPEAREIRDKLIAMYPLPAVTGEVEPAMTTLGEITAFAPAQAPAITINIAHLTVNA